jgi:predicted enzyme related to lactoylglutathione lyase
MPYHAIRHITFDAHDPHELARFWGGVLGLSLDPETEDGDDEVLLEPPAPGVPGVLFIRVGDEKLGKNRVHLDLQQATGTRDAEVERVRALGASVYEDHRRPDGTGWVTMRDPEDNEFCVERTAEERGVVA